MYPRTIRNFNAFIDGVSYFGRVAEAKMPMLQLQTEDHRGAGMDAPIAVDMGLQALSAEISFHEWVPELITLFGTKQRLVLRPGAMGENDFSADTFIATIGGRWSTMEPTNLRPSQAAPLKLITSCDYFRMEMNGSELFEIDVENGKRVIGGTDQLEGIRQAMGI
jgi:P2 family phage contractile tail tube protein